LFGGGAGGGKSDALLIDFTRYIGDRYYQGILFRRSYPELEELIARSRELYEPIGAKFNSGSKTWRFPSGATLKFRYAEKDDDIRRYQGHAYQWVAFDELTHFSKFMWEFMSTRNRPRRTGQRCVMRATCNPDGKGLLWVKAMFIDVAQPNQMVRRWIENPITGDRQCITQMFIPSLLADNPYLSGGSYALNMALLSEADKRALLHGDWNAYTGRVFNFIQGVHVWSWDQFRAVYGVDRIPASWPRFRVMDWGFAKPFSVIWLAVDPVSKRAIAYREWYGCEVDAHGASVPNTGAKIPPEKVAERIANIEHVAGESITMSWTGPDLDHSGRGDHEGGAKISEKFSLHGVYFRHWDAGKGSRRAKKLALHSRLAFTRGKDGSVKDWPGLVIIGSECPELLRTVPALEYDKHDPEDVDSSGEDHAYDALAAFCLMRPYAPETLTLDNPRWLESMNSVQGMVI